METKILDIIRERFDEQNPSRNQHLREDLFLDSLDIVELCMEVEKRCDVSIPDEDMAGWDTVQDIVNTVNAIRNESGD